jgi:hypothetical protein
MDITSRVSLVIPADYLFFATDGGRARFLATMYIL